MKRRQKVEWRQLKGSKKSQSGIRRTRSSFSDLRAKKTFLPFWFWSFPFCYEDRIWPWQPREQRRKHVLTQRERTRRSYLPHAKCVSCAGIVACRCLSTGGIEYSCGPSLNLVKLLSEAHLVHFLICFNHSFTSLSVNSFNGFCWCSNFFECVYSLVCSLIWQSHVQYCLLCIHQCFFFFICRFIISLSLHSNTQHSPAFYSYFLGVTAYVSPVMEWPLVHGAPLLSSL